jgi:hypothetical protein
VCWKVCNGVSGLRKSLIGFFHFLMCREVSRLTGMCMESDNTRHACVYARMALAHFRGFELTPLEIQTLDFVLQGRGLQGEICQALI